MHHRKLSTPAGREDERGVALVIVLLVLMLSAILAVEIKASAALHWRLAKNKLSDFGMREKMRGQLEILKQVILYDEPPPAVESGR